MLIKKYWKYHLTLALFFILLEYLEDYILRGRVGLMDSFSTRSLILQSSFWVACSLVYFINLDFVAPRYLKRSRLPFFVLSFFVLIFVFAGFRYFVDEIVIFEITGEHNYHDSTRKFVYYVYDNSFFVFKPFIYSTFVYMLINNFERKDLNHELELAKKKAELDLLKSQISPHFLFNTMNSFYVELYDSNPSAAADIQKLSDLLRYVIYESQEDFNPLEKEIGFLDDYVHFYRKRYEENFHVDFLVDKCKGGVKVPTLILINFVENLFKHGIVNDERAKALVRLSCTESELIFETRNKTNNADKMMESGIGNSSVIQRLNVLYGDDFHLEQSIEGDIYISILKLPI